MKRAAAFTVTVLLVFLCSCSTDNVPETICICQNFSSEIEIQYKSTAYTADFTNDENGCSAVFLSPDALKGFKMGVKGDEITYSLMSLEFTAKSTPKQALPLQAIHLAIKSPYETVTKNEEGYTLCGNTKFGNYVMNIDGKNLTPTFIEYDKAGITVRFKECNIK